MRYPHRKGEHKHLTDFEFYEEASDKLDLHDPHCDKYMDYAELLEIEVDEETGQFIKPNGVTNE